MNHLLRYLNLAFTALLALAASAQYTVVVVGQLTPCAPANAGGTVTVTTTSFLEPPQTLTALLDANCSFQFNMTVSNPSGGLFIATSCGDGTMATDSVAYDVGSGLMDSLFVTLTCGGSSACNADFTVQQAMGGGAVIPWQITTTNLSTGNGTLAYQWWMPDGSSSTDAEPSWTFNAPGVYGICLTIIADNGNCTDWFCDTVVVDTNGLISTDPVWYDCQGVLGGNALPGSPCDDGNPMTTGTVWDSNCQCGEADSTIVDCLGVPGGAALPGTPCTTFLGTPGTWNNNCLCVADSSNVTDCLGIVNGPNLPGTPCDDGNPMTNGEVWSADCDCVSDTTSLGCEANFWAVQAYQADSLNPAGGTPIPNEVWVWNLSSGGNGSYQFFWDFGDGTSSTEAYPTHVYSGNGPWLLCLTMTSGNCTDTYCDSISVDENGILNGLIVDGHPLSTTYSPRSGGFTLNVISEIPSGISELNADAELRLWPNPVDNALNVAFQATGGTGTLSIIDGNGRTVKAIAERFTSGTNRLTIPVDELAPGLYLMRLSNGNNSISARFLKTR